MDKTAIILGGSGYIGRNLLQHFLNEKFFSKYIVGDIVQLEGFEKFPEVTFKRIDVRKPIEIEDLRNVDKENSWIFNLAAIHREPGHAYFEYFDTNIPGANNTCDLARKTGIRNVYFTSSIAPYGRSKEERTENSNLYPETAYGISKAIAEKIHETWLAEHTDRRLIICRPSVIFGPKDPGNVYRMIKALKKGMFVLPNGGNVIKAYGYVYGLVDSIIFTIDNQTEPLIVYNYAEHPLVTLREMTSIVKKKLGYTKPVLSISTTFLAMLARVIQVFTKIVGKKNEIHPVRVKKAGFPTNVKPKYLIDKGFDFRYGFEKSLEHWKRVAPEDF